MVATGQHLQYNTTRSCQDKAPFKHKQKNQGQGAIALGFDSDPVQWQRLEVTKEATLRLNPQQWPFCSANDQNQICRASKRNQKRNFFNLPPRYHSSFVLGSLMLGSCSGSCLCRCGGGASGGRASCSRGRRSRCSRCSRSWSDQSWRSDWHSSGYIHPTHLP